jgi:hypothetical protein
MVVYSRVFGEIYQSHRHQSSSPQDCINLAERQAKEKVTRKVKRSYILVVYYSDVWTSFSNRHTEIFEERNLRKAYDGAVQFFSGL